MLFDTCSSVPNSVLCESWSSVLLQRLRDCVAEATAQAVVPHAVVIVDHETRGTIGTAIRKHPLTSFPLFLLLFSWMTWPRITADGS